MERKDERLALEVLRESKAQTKRWFIIAIVELVVLILTIISFLWYISLPLDTASDDVAQNSTDSSTNQYVGGDYSGN